MGRKGNPGSDVDAALATEALDGYLAAGERTHFERV